MNMFDIRFLEQPALNRVALASFKRISGVSNGMLSGFP